MLTTLALAGTIGCSRGGAPKVIGIATMGADGTIAMQVRVEDPASGAVGHRYTQIKPGEPRYKETLDHYSGLKPGNSKPILDDWP